ncbi:MAG: hypothetical protein AB7S75_07785 [Desulfococcaceae bacterium]
MKMYQIPLPFFSEDYHRVVMEILTDRGKQISDDMFDRLSRLMEYFEFISDILMRSRNYFYVSFYGYKSLFVRHYVSGWAG